MAHGNRLISRHTSGRPKLNQRVRGRGVLDFLALFRHRGPPRRARKPGNGGWQDTDLTALGGPISSAKSSPAKSSRARQRVRREEPVERAEVTDGYLAAHGL